jgi:dienelactone hydrolase
MAEATRQDDVLVRRVAFDSLHRPEPLAIPAIFRMPQDAARPTPAVVVVHGSAGVDSRGPAYARALNAAGVATLEIDMWAARGVKGALERPRTIQETLPDAFGAFRFLASDPAIDAARIGVMGFSWGGVVSMLTATRPYTVAALGEGARFAAHAPLYPVCWLYNRVPGFEFRDFTGAPIFIQCGERDAYDLPDTGEKLVQSLAAIAPGLASIRTYADATHAFDRSEPAMTVTDPFSHLGQGGEVLFAPNPEAAAQARAATVAFFRRAFGC